MAAKKKSAKGRKKATAKRPAKKKAAKKKAAKKKAATKRKAGRRKSATRKSSAAKRNGRSTKRKDADEVDTDEPAAEIAPEVDEAPPPVDTPIDDDTDVPLPEARRRARVIPPLPDEEEDFVPVEDDEIVEPSRTAPKGAKPMEILEGVKAGTLHVSTLEDLSDDELAALVKEAGLKSRRRERRAETIYRLMNERPAARRRERERERESIHCDGLLEMHPDGYGFLRRPERNFSQHPTDIYVPAGLIRRLSLKPGHWIEGRAHRKSPGHPQLALHSIDKVNDEDPESIKDMVPFEKLTVIHPDQRFVLETAQDDVEMRVMDLFCPLGMGQRALIVAPPRTGKTVLLTKIADAVALNSPNVQIVVLLLDERPEEVTNMRRSVRGEVVASTFDRPASNHIRVAELVIEKVKRMVEFGQDVVLLLDSITRMGRAYNNQAGGSGRILSGGLDANALTKPKRFFGSARNVEDGGSLTIIATALVDTGSRMDEVIFEEFKGTGNMEVILDRDMANTRVWPAINLPASGTRNEDLLLHPDELKRVSVLRRGITGQEPQAVMTALRKKMKTHKTNAEFLMAIGG